MNSLFFAHYIPLASNYTCLIVNSSLKDLFIASTEKWKMENAVRSLEGNAWEPANHGSEGNYGTEVSRFVCKDVAMQKKLHILVSTY